MRYFIILFSLYMTFLTVAPCQDREDAVFATIDQPTYRTHTNANGHAEEESCPPFCTCACCSVSRNITDPIHRNTVMGSTSLSYCEYKMPAIADQVVEIYQPPQLA